MGVTTSNSTGREGVPAGYREVLYWRLGERPRRAILINLLALLLLVLWLFVFGWLGQRLGGQQSERIGLQQLILVLAGWWLTVVLHELGHGLAIRAFGGHPKFGVLWTQLMVYATAPGHAFRRSSYIVVALAPLVGLTLLALLGMIALAGTPWVFLIVLCASANAAGASGDLWIVTVVLGYPSSACVIDERDGMRILLPA